MLRVGIHARASRGRAGPVWRSLTTRHALPAASCVAPSESRRGSDAYQALSWNTRVTAGGARLGHGTSTGIVPGAKGNRSTRPLEWHHKPARAVAAAAPAARLLTEQRRRPYSSSRVVTPDDPGFGSGVYDHTSDSDADAPYAVPATDGHRTHKSRRTLAALGEELYPSSASAGKLVAAAGAPLGFADSASLAGQELPADDLLAVAFMIRAFRTRGHNIADVDPLGRSKPGKKQAQWLTEMLRNFPAEIDLQPFGIGHLDLDTPYVLGTRARLPKGRTVWTLREVVHLLARTYCGPIATEYMLLGREERTWIRNRLEHLHYVGGGDTLDFDDRLKREERIQVLKWLIQAERFEQFLDTKFPASKRFGLEGAEALMPALLTIVGRASVGGVQHIEVGMPHRGRLNVLAHLMHKPLGAIFSEFSSRRADMQVGDVKYHLGTQTTIDLAEPEDGSDVVGSGAATVVRVTASAAAGTDDDAGARTTAKSRMSINLNANPSHLEAVDPVVMGRTRARQHLLTHGTRGPDSPPRKQTTADEACDRDAVSAILGLLIHGDASFSGQGIVSETLQLSGLTDYTVGGMVHVLVNNQIGFTTNPHRSRTTPHPTDIARAIDVPILHVNADDPDAVVCAAAIAIDWRQTFHQSVVLDLVCYRRRGHNEQDEPSYTQPLMYDKIAEHPTVIDIYAQQLIEQGVLTNDDVRRIMDEQDALLERELADAESYQPSLSDWVAGTWQASAIRDMLAHVEDGVAVGPSGAEASGVNTDVDGGDGGGGGSRGDAELMPATVYSQGARRRWSTGVERDALTHIGAHMTTLPDDFTAHKELSQLMRKRARLVEKGKKIDWSCAEALALGSLLSEGHHVRLTGQDSERGTFNQRHCVLYDQTDERRHVTLAGLGASFHIGNSSLSEAATLGFEYGYSQAHDNALVIWEAQFGDFANTAQHVIDCFISSGEQKWFNKSSLVMLLPHGFDGQGPDHSNARIERYLQMCNDDADAIPGSSRAQQAAIDVGFTAVDVDGSGTLSRDEVFDAVALTLQAAMSVEADSDGEEVALEASDFLDEDEVMAMFDAVDTDGSGDIDRDEWRAFMANYLRRNAQSAHNLLVVNCSTPANYFHALRRQIHGDVTKPLVVAAPKYLLHHGPCASSLVDMGPGTCFQPVLQDDDADVTAARDDVKRVVICSGSLFYTLRRARHAAKRSDIALVRLEQLSPFPYDELASAVLGTYPNATSVVYAQEEPKNMGAAEYVRPRMATLFRELAEEHNFDVAQLITAPGSRESIVSRAAAAAATGSFHVHRAELKRLTRESLQLPEEAEAVDTLDS